MELSSSVRGGVAAARGESCLFHGRAGLCSCWLQGRTLHWGAVLKGFGGGLPFWTVFAWAKSLFLCNTCLFYQYVLQVIRKGDKMLILIPFFFFLMQSGRRYLPDIFESSWRRFPIFTTWLPAQGTALSLCHQMWSKPWNNGSTMKSWHFTCSRWPFSGILGCVVFFQEKSKFLIVLFSGG